MCVILTETAAFTAMHTYLELSPMERACFRVCSNRAELLPWEPSDVTICLAPPILRSAGESLAGLNAEAAFLLRLCGGAGPGARARDTAVCGRKVALPGQSARSA